MNSQGQNRTHRKHAITSLFISLLSKISFITFESLQEILKNKFMRAVRSNETDPIEKFYIFIKLSIYLLNLLDSVV